MNPFYLLEHAHKHDCLFTNTGQVNLHKYINMNPFYLLEYDQKYCLPFYRICKLALDCMFP